MPSRMSRLHVRLSHRLSAGQGFVAVPQRRRRCPRAGKNMMVVWGSGLNRAYPTRWTRFCCVVRTRTAMLHQKDYEEDRSDWSQQSTANDSDTRRESENNQCSAPSSPGEFVRGRACDQGSRLNSIWCETATSGHIDPAVVLYVAIMLCMYARSVARIYLFAAAIAGS